MGLQDVVLCDRQGAIYQGREGLNAVKEEMALLTIGKSESARWRMC